MNEQKAHIEQRKAPQSFWFNMALLQDLDITTASIFILFKQYSNSTIYNKKVYQLAKIFKISPTVLSRHLKTLKDKGYIHASGRNLTAVSIRKSPLSNTLYNKGWRKIIDTSNFKAIKDQLYALTILENAYRQRYKSKQKAKDLYRMQQNTDKNSVVTKRAIARLKVEISEDITFSSRGLGRLWGVSHTTALVIIRRLKKTGVISVEYNTKVLLDMKIQNDKNFSNKGITMENLRKTMGCYMYQKNGLLIGHKGMIIKFINPYSNEYSNPPIIYTNTIGIYSVSNKDYGYYSSVA